MDLSHKWDFETLRSNKSNIKKIFFYRVCGTGMGAAACLLREKGYHVEGADHKFLPPMSDYLKSTGIACHTMDKINEDLIKEFDLIVVGNVVPRNSEDARFIENCGIPFISFPSALGALVLSETNVVGIAGTHGKTTTTYFFSQVFEKLGIDPGYFVGGVIEGSPSSKLGDGRYFFIESDEYDSAYFEKISKFRMYSIKNLILTSLEFDHADIFNDLEDIKDQFRALIPTVNSHFLMSEDYQAIKDLYSEFGGETNEQWSFYGESSSTGPKNIKMQESGSKFDLSFNGDQQTYETNIIGLHNILNLSSVILFALAEGFSVSDVKKAILDLKMVKRRQEVRGHFQGCPIIDDFAHHPRAVELTINTIRVKYPNKKIIVVFEPHSATARSALFQAEFTEAFACADKVIFTKPPRPTSVKEVGDLDCDLMVKTLSEKGIKSEVIESLEQLRAEFKENLSNEDVLLVLSNGTCLGLWESDFVKELQ